MKECKMLGVSVAIGTREELLSRALDLLESGGSIATVNATMLEYARTHKSFRDTLCEMNMRLPDGQGVCRAFQRRGVTTEALAGVELGLLLLTARPYLRLALYGGRSGVAMRASEAILSLSPTTEVVYVKDGYHHTPFEVARDLAALSPDLVYICLGSPKQEEVARMLSHILPKALIIGLGGSFDVWCGDKRRAPEKIQKMGLEWFYRMIKEPKRFVKLPTLLSFSYHSFIEDLQQNPQKRRKKV